MSIPQESLLLRNHTQMQIEKAVVPISSQYDCKMIDDLRAMEDFFTGVLRAEQILVEMVLFTCVYYSDTDSVYPSLTNSIILI